MITSQFANTVQHLQQQCDCGNGAHSLSQSWTEMNSDLWIHHSWTGKARLNWPVIQALVEVTGKWLIFVGRKCNVTVKIKKHPESKFKKQFTFPSHLLNSFICVFTADFSFFYLFILMSVKTYTKYFDQTTALESMVLHFLYVCSNLGKAGKLIWIPK